MNYTDLTPILNVVHSGSIPDSVNDQAALLGEILNGNQDQYEISGSSTGLKSVAGVQPYYQSASRNIYNVWFNLTPTRLVGREIIDTAKGVLSPELTEVTTGYLFDCYYWAGPGASFQTASVYPYGYELNELISFNFNDTKKCWNSFRWRGKYYIIDDLTYTSTVTTAGTTSVNSPIMHAASMTLSNPTANSSFKLIEGDKIVTKIEGFQLRWKRIETYSASTVTLFGGAYYYAPRVYVDENS